MKKAQDIFKVAKEDIILERDEDVLDTWNMFPASWDQYLSQYLRGSAGNRQQHTRGSFACKYNNGVVLETSHSTC